MNKTITLIIIIISFFVWVSEFHHDFKQTKFLYALYFERSTIQKDVLIEEKRYNVDGNPTDLYYVEGCLKNNKVEKIISGYMPSLDKDENGDFLVWYCNFKDISYILTREKEENQIPFFYFNPWFHFVLLVLFIPLLLYYLKLKIEKNKK
ncbi:hypothetical protein [Tenacibaculum discolor]|uniref:hypothetical protein n=1 Tax=Tenacibaculum discolor TaxID=361581 RepID=UPI000EAEE0D6|nr:hypothetical protein [Tenacibaculum discolor]RLK00431.1 hypothetical protein C8N27_2118 [Tenacibaculum discolor]